MELEEIWNGWKIEQPIGEGSFGKVYKIVREEFGHKYVSALKVIEIPQNQAEYKTIKNDGLSDDNITEYFRGVVEDIVNEFALMSQLKGNSNIVSYEDHAIVKKKDEFGWTIYIRMELLTPLFTYLEQNAFRVRDVIQLGIDICKALEVCQKFNIIHRDIKPENIFVSDIGTYKIGDFGIARKLEKTTSGMSKKGTYTYMAPEVYKGLSYNSTVDTYSLGIVLYRFLNNNRTPFMPPAPSQIRYSDKEQANVMRLSGQKMPKPCNAEGRLAEIVLKACAYDPKDRYESPYAMRQELQTLLYTEKEKTLAYPKGDDLSNDKNEYTIGDTTQIIDEFSSTNVSEDDVTTITESLHSDSEIIITQSRLKRNYKKIVRISGVCIAVFAIVLSYGIWSIKTPKEPELIMKRVPYVTDITVDKAQKLLDEQGLEMQISYQASKTAALNTVISQHEIVGTEMEEGGTVHIVVCNSIIKDVPNVVDMNAEDAKVLLEKDNFSVKISNQYSDTVKKGLVIAQKPEASTELEEGNEITLTVSKGERLITVPDVKNLTQTKAKEKLEKSGLKVLVKITSHSV